MDLYVEVPRTIVGTMFMSEPYDTISCAKCPYGNRCVGGSCVVGSTGRGCASCDTNCTASNCTAARYARRAAS